GDALNPESYGSLLDGDRADMVFADPPYNVAIEGNVSGHGATRHDDFAMATGEMSPAEFAKFLQDSFSLVAQHSINGAIHFICMDWRHLEELMGATKTIYSELKIFASGTSRTQGWDRSTVRSTSSYLCSRTATNHTSTTLISGASGEAGAMSGIMPATMASTALAKVSLLCIRR